jgi:hypothetical protein
MASELLYITCLNATRGDESYCKQVLNTLSKLSRERAVAYSGARGVKHVVVLPDDDNPVVDIAADNNKNMVVKIKSTRYAALIRYNYEGTLKPAHAVISNLEVVNMLNMHMSFQEILSEIFKRVEGHG